MAYKVSFSEMKSRVGIDDVAYSLGYTLDRKAGVGKYFELVLGPAQNPSDRLIIKNTTDKSRQTFFRRNGSHGDVVTFIKENINIFNVDGKDDWSKIINVLAKFANMPPAEYSDRKAVEEAKTSSRQFDPDRYSIAPVGTEPIHWLLSKRGFNKECIEDFGNHLVMIKDKNQKNFDGFNIGFPYRNPDTEEITGYEIRGGNSFKSKAAGTDSSNSFWFAEFGGERSRIRNVYLFESSFDAMAFYQKNRNRIISSPFALVSMGGSFTQSQVEGVAKRFSKAKLWDCFDNDLAGNVYSKNLVVYSEKQPLDIQYRNGENGEKLVVLSKGTDQIVKESDRFNFKEAAKELGVKYNMGHWKAPSNYKDWNDCLLDKKIEYIPAISKRERDERLKENRKTKNSMSL